MNLAIKILCRVRIPLAKGSLNGLQYATDKNKFKRMIEMQHFRQKYVIKQQRCRSASIS